MRVGRISYVFDDELHADLKVWAAQEGVTLYELLQRVLAEAVDARKAERAEHERKRRGR